MKKTTIYLVRHAEVYNPEHIIYGRLPGFRLSEQGRFQAQRMYDYFKTKNIALISSSPLLRARKTAAIISGGRITIKYSRKLLEANYTEWEGLHADDRMLDKFDQYVRYPSQTQLGETLQEMEVRMISAIYDLVEKYRGKSVIVVSHADPILVAWFSFAERSFDYINRQEIRNCSIVKLVFDENKECIDNEYIVIVDAKKDLA